MSSTSYLCPHCDCSYEKLGSFRQHLRRNHKVTASEPSNKCDEPNCEKRFFRINELRNHLKQDHGIALTFQELTFDSFEQFNSWKKSIEQECNVRFVKSTGNKSLSQNSAIIITYECHRSGFMRPQPNAEEVNSTKLNRRCLAQIKLIKNDAKSVHLFVQNHQEDVILYRPMTSK
jgi:hypothetical protein